MNGLVLPKYYYMSEIKRIDHSTTLSNGVKKGAPVGNFHYICSSLRLTRNEIPKSCTYETA